MLTFEVQDITCGHCASKIARAVTSLDAHAQVEVNIAQKLVRITSSAPDAEIASAIGGAWYTARRVEGRVPAASGKAMGGCCCGSRRAAAARDRAPATSYCGS